MKILDGRLIKGQILDELKREVNKLAIKPNLVVIQVGNNEASNIYINQKKKMADYVGYGFNLIKYSDDVNEEIILKKINELNNDKNVHAILVQMPLPNHLNSINIQNAVSVLKDVDGLNDINAGKLFHNKDGLFPCTPFGVMELLCLLKAHTSFSVRVQLMLAFRHLSVQAAFLP